MNSSKILDFIGVFHLFYVRWEVPRCTYLMIESGENTDGIEKKRFLGFDFKLAFVPLVIIANDRKNKRERSCRE